MTRTPKWLKKMSPCPACNEPIFYSEDIGDGYLVNMRLHMARCKDHPITALREENKSLRESLALEREYYEEKFRQFAEQHIIDDSDPLYSVVDFHTVMRVPKIQTVQS